MKMHEYLLAGILSFALFPGLVAAQDFRGVSGVVSRPLLPPEQVREQGHPKLVALLVGEDYARGAGRPDWGGLGELPGVWQDLARVKRRLEKLGFGKVVALAGNQANGGRKQVSVQGISGAAEEPAGAVSLTFDGPATRAAMVAAANALKAHLNANRTADDGRGGEVPPLFVFYYSGHGFVNAQGAHCLPLADNVSGEPTGNLIDLIVGTVGADDPARGSAGGGSALVFLDCCQAGKALGAGARAGAERGGLLESGIMDAIRAGRRGRFLIGASLGDEQAKESPAGGHFTSALCASLSPERLGRGLEEEATLSLNHLVFAVDRMLLEMGAQAVSRFPPPGEVAWDNYVLFSNPHHKEAEAPVRLYVTTVPAGARVLGEEGGAFRDIELLSGGFLLDRALSREGRQVYVAPAAWRGRTLRLKAVAASAEGRVKYEPSPEREVALAPDPSGAPPIVALALRDARTEAGASGADAAFARAQRVYEAARKVSGPLEQYRQYQAARDLLEGASHPFAGPVVQAIDGELGALRPKAGAAELERMVRLAEAPAAQDRYREAYDRLKALNADDPGLKEFGMGAGGVRARIEKARVGALENWNAWAEAERKEEADRRIAQGERFLRDGQPWQGWRYAFEAGILLGEDERIRGLEKRSQERAVEGFLDSKVTLDVLVSNGAYGILSGLLQGQGPFARSLGRALSERYRLTADSLDARMGADYSRFREAHPDWFPPIPAPAPGPATGIPVAEPASPEDAGEEMAYVPSVKSHMVYVSPGEFPMGSKDGGSDEKPVHTVYLDGFYIDKYEVTVAQYREFVRATGRSMPAAPSWGWQDRHPVVNVTWHDADAYCRWAGKRLPTEAEWAKACRGADGRTYPWGNVFDGRRLNFADQSTDYSWKDESLDDGYTNTAPVGSFSSGASPSGAMDMAGNVWEWCADWYGSRYYSQSLGRNPEGPESGKYRVIRGGSWSNDPNVVRCANRIGSGSMSSSYDYGIRCVRSP